MNRKRDRFHGGSLATRLRREAVADRPAFSADFHDRLRKRLAREPLQTRIPVAVPIAIPAIPRGRRTSAPLPAAAFVAALAMFMITAETRRQEGGAGQGDVLGVATVGPDKGPAAVADLIGVDGAVGLDGLPMFDEIDAGVREGVASLAISLLDMPDWTKLAAFEARLPLDSAWEAGDAAAR